MTAPDRYQWRRDKDGLGVWEHRGKVAVAGVGHSPVDRRWDGVSMDKTLGAYSILACRKALDDAGVTPDQVDGVICCDSHIAGGSGGSASQWAPRPYFAPPYDSEWGLTLVNAQWLIEQMHLPNVKFAPTGRGRSDQFLFQPPRRPALQGAGGRRSRGDVRGGGPRSAHPRVACRRLAPRHKVLIGRGARRSPCRAVSPNGRLGGRPPSTQPRHPAAMG